MTTPKVPNRSVAKLKFIAAYLLSVVLLFVLLSSFLKIGSVQTATGNSSPAATKNDNRLVVDELLHQRMDRLSNACASFADRSGSKEAADALQREERSFDICVDSLRKSTASLAGAEKQQLQNLLDGFSRDADRQVQLVKTHAAVNKDSPGAAAAKPSAELEELKAILVQKEQKIQDLRAQNTAALQEKEKTIAALQSKASNPSQVVVTKTVPDASAAEWKDKYEKLKATNDKLKEASDKYTMQANQLKAAYKEVVDDNRRLINQLQSLRNGRN